MEPYSLRGVPKAQLAPLTVVMLQSHLNHFKLSTQGKKAILVDHLHSHLLSLEDNIPNPPPPNPPKEAPTTSTQSAHSHTPPS